MNTSRITLSFLIICCFLALAPLFGAETPDAFAGTWRFDPKVDRTIQPQYKEIMSKPFELTFTKDATGKWVITGNPFGFLPGKGKLKSAIPNGTFEASTPYSNTEGGSTREFDISLRGSLNKECNTISFGKFTAQVGSGTFTATKVK